MNCDRIMIVGCPGSGKTTFAVELGEILEREVVHLDKLLWLPNWQMMEYEERRKIHNHVISGDRWIVDGMWRSHVAERIERATLVYFLDYPRRISMWRALVRRIRFGGKQRFDIADGCKEQLDSYFINYIKNFRRDVRPYLVSQLECNKDHLEVITFTHPRQAKRYLKQLRARQLN